MATKKKKIHYYVLVMSTDGPKFVTKINNSDRTAEWNWNEKPLELDKDWAEQLALGLTVNGNSAFTIAQIWELDHQPYNYDEWKISWVKREKENEDDT